MSLYVLDTDILTLYRNGHTLITQRIEADLSPDLAITVMSVEEQLSGWYTMLRQVSQPPDLARAYQELADSTQFLGGWDILSFTEPAITQYDRLATMKLNVRKMDLRIAAITLEHGGILVTRNLRDFQRVPNLIVEDWSV
jgi:tRNA(fMet)-specific endonuclease VapC